METNFALQRSDVSKKWIGSLNTRYKGRHCKMMEVVPHLTEKTVNMLYDAPPPINSTFRELLT